MFFLIRLEQSCVCCKFNERLKLRFFVPELHSILSFLFYTVPIQLSLYIYYIKCRLTPFK